VIFLVKNKGDEYKCDECGLVVLVENPCECDETCELVCCSEPMKQVKPASAKSSSASKAPAKASEKPKK
jgi:hypothetical protein